MTMTLAQFVALIIALCATMTDLRTRRIPNLLTFGAAAAAIVFHTLGGGVTGTLTAAGGWLAGAALFMPFFLLRGMGAGDVKLLAALGAWLGAGDAFRVAIYTSLAGGVMALAVSAAHGYLRTVVRNVWNLTFFWCLAGPRPMPELTLERSAGPRLAYAVPICAGTVLTLWLR